MFIRPKNDLRFAHLCYNPWVDHPHQANRADCMQSNGQSSMRAPAADAIVVDALSKTYQVPEREGGFGAAVRSFFRRKHRDVKAVQGVNFKISEGEIVGFLGPNGAGKTTTLKMLSGLLHPTSGKATVLDFTPWELKPDYLRSMTLVMGQRN